MSIDQQIATLRRFNRSYTQRVGALEDSFLGLGLPLGAMRLLFEIGARPGTMGALRERLGLDSGYATRLLRRLEEGDLVETAPDPGDRRRRIVTLTTEGRRRWKILEERSQARAGALIEPLTERQRARLVAALAEADLLVRAATVRLDVVDPSEPVARQAIHRYFDELRQRFSFDESGLDAKDAQLLGPPNGAFLLAVSDGTPVACGGVQRIGASIGEIKRMWVDAAWRGAGLGSRVLRQLEGHATKLGYRTVRMDTNEELTEAIAMYERAGYRAIDRYNDNSFATHFFEKRLAWAQGRADGG